MRVFSDSALGHLRTESERWLCQLRLKLQSPTLPPGIGSRRSDCRGGLGCLETTSNQDDAVKGDIEVGTQR